MTFGTGSFGESSFGEEAGGGGSGPQVYSATIEQIILLTEYQFNAIVESRVYTDAQFSATIEQQIVYPSSVFSATLEQRIWESSTLAATIEQQVYGDVTGVWSPVVVIDGVDISDDVTGDIRITSSEGGSSIADITFIPPDGAIDLLSWVGVSVTIDYLDAGWQVRKFTGICASPQYSPRNGTVALSCTTDMQGAMEAKTRAEINAIIPDGKWSKDVFEDNADGWKYAQDLASTSPGSLWSDKNRAVRFTPWAAKTTPDLTLTEAAIINGEVEIKHASKRDMIKRVLVQLDYRFYNLRTRQHSFIFQYNADFCDFLQNSFKLPTKTMVRSAAESTGWQLDSIGYTDLPGTQYFECSGQHAGARYRHLFVSNNLSKASCFGANFKASKRWAQRVTENYLIDVRCENDLAVANQYAVLESWGVESDYDASEWENAEVSHVGLSQGASNDPPSGGGLHPGGSGDYSEEADTERRSEMEQAQRAILAKAATEIQETHRKTEVTFSILMRPQVDLSSTIKIITPQVTAQGKVSRIDETLSVRTGEAVSRITMSLSRKAGVGIETGDHLAPVTRPDPTQETPFKRTVRLGFRVGGVASGAGGGLQGSGDNDDDFNGYSTNYQTADPDDPSLTFYSERMTVIAPEIEKSAIDATVLAAEQVVSVAVVDDLLTLTK